MDGPRHDGTPPERASDAPPSSRSPRLNDRTLHILSGVLILILLGVMLATVLDYGMTADEPVQNRYGRRLVRWYATLGADRAAVEQHDTWLYGGFFELLAQAAQAVSPLGVYETRHVVNALFGLLGVVGAWWMGAQLAGPLGGLLSALFLTLTPAFYGHAFANPKDIPFASLFALAAAAGLHARARLPWPGWRALAATGAAIGLTAGVRVAGIVLFGYTAVLWLGELWLRRGAAAAQVRPPPTREWARVSLALLVVLAVGWSVMVAFWPYAQPDPVRHPFQAFRAFTRFWEGMLVLYDGELVRSGDVSRFSIPKLFALTLPEWYLVAFLLGAQRLVATVRASKPRAALARLFPALSVLALATLPIAWAVALHTPFYNGHRHLLFVVPPLAVLAGASVASYLRSDARRPAKLAAGAVLALGAAVTLADMVALHPYQSVYFNRLIAGGLAHAAERYETDYWCSTYREGIEWVVDHYSRQDLRERVRVAGHSTLIQVSYDLRRTEERQRRFQPVTIHDHPHVVLATTATRDHERTPGRPVHVVERLGTPLLYVFEVRPPR